MTLRLRYWMRPVRCDACGGVATEQVTWAAPISSFTHAFEERTDYLAQQCSKTAVSKLMRVAWRTVDGLTIRREAIVPRRPPCFHAHS